MMNFDIKKQDSYSRGELLLRALFGWLYILIPHYFVLLVYSIGSMFYSLWTFFSILFTRKYPEDAHNFFVKVGRYSLRLGASLYNMRDGYPGFSLDQVEEGITFDMPYRPEIKRRVLLVRHLFAIFLLLPHIIVLYIKLIAFMFVSFFAFWVVLFTGEFSDGMFNFQVRTLRYFQRINNYFTFYTEDYPPFHGRVLPGENEGTGDAGNNAEDHLVDSKDSE